jgi:hypothetical protein
VQALFGQDCVRRKALRDQRRDDLLRRKVGIGDDVALALHGHGAVLRPARQQYFARGVGGFEGGLEDGGHGRLL